MTAGPDGDATAAAAARSERVYYRPPRSPTPLRIPATLDLSTRGLTLTELGGPDVMACPTGDVRKVVIDHATLHFHLAQRRVAVALYPTGQSRAAGAPGRFIYLGFFVNGWSNLRDGRLRGWKRALRANGVRVADRNVQLVPALAVVSSAFVALLLAAVAIQVAEWL